MLSSSRVAPLVLVLLLAPAGARATSFEIDPALSQLSISNATFQSTATPPFVTDLVPAPGTSFTRSVGGSIEADPLTGLVDSGDWVLLGDALAADQTRTISGRPPRDIGDFTLTSLGLSFDSLAVATLTAGFVEYDLSTGASRIRSTVPIDVSGETTSFLNLAGPPTVADVGGTRQLTYPVLVHVEDLHVTSNGNVSFTVAGTVVANVPEPSSGALVALGLAGLGVFGRRRRRPRASRVQLVALVALLALPLAGCPELEEEEEEEMLPPVEAIDDSAATQQGVPVTIEVLANDLTDDDLLLGFESAATDELGNLQPDSVDSEFLSTPFREALEYTPPEGFVGTATFTYEVGAWGDDYDWATTDTGTVKVVVTEGLPPVDAVDDMALTDVDVPVAVDVLLNDSQDADAIDSFTDAMDDMGNVQLGSVALVTNGFKMLEYTPPPGFVGTVDFDYAIAGAGVTFDAGSMDTALVTIDVEAPPTGPAQMQFKDDTTSLAFLEGAALYVGQAAIDAQIDTAFLFQLGEASTCFPFPAGVDVPLQARVFENGLFIVNGVCAQILAGTDYTIRLIDGASGLELVCDEGVIDDPVACAGP